MKLTEHHALIFDVYGTLVDWESAIHDALVPVFPDLSREKILVSYAGVEGNLQTQFQSTSYSKILELAFRQLSTSSGVTMAGVAEGELRKEQPASTSDVKEEPAPPSSSDDAERFGRSIPDWKPFPDTIDALHRLKKHFALVVLSNVDDRSFSGTHEKLCSPDYPGSAYRTITPASPFSLILTAQQVGAYKPNPLMLESALKQLSANPDPSLPSNPSVRVDPSEVLVVANSIRHDIIPAMHRNLHSVWISRHGVNFIGSDSNIAAHYSDKEGATTEDDKYPCTCRYETLGRMADAVEEEVQKLSDVM
ncbi:haloacid dehalogenase [Boletus coccyginus]|nr:haloacid dehalogenase [Boletus coccyginus]